jgi:hypothetical protein
MGWGNSWSIYFLLQWNGYVETEVFRLAREIVAKRFGPDKLVQKNMLVSFIKNELSQNEPSG